jgi:hypothetical protein
MPITRVEFADHFANRHLYFNGPDLNLGNQVADVHSHAHDVERARHTKSRAAHVPANVRGIGAKTPSTTIDVDELEIAMFREKIMHSLNNSGMAFNAADHVSFSVALEDRMNISADKQAGLNQANNAPNGALTSHSTYARLAGTVEQNGTELVFVVNHFDALLPAPAAAGLIVS